MARSPQTSGHIVYDCHYHVVFCTKYRRKVLTEAVAAELLSILRSLSDSNETAFTIEEMEVMPDHVHLLMSVDARMSTHGAVSRIKGVTAHTLRQHHPWLKSRIPSLWTRSYFIATTGGASLDKIKRYIQNQKRAQ